jgi:hypothetical protein
LIETIRLNSDTIRQLQSQNGQVVPVTFTEEELQAVLAQNEKLMKDEADEYDEDTFTLSLKMFQIS